MDSLTPHHEAPPSVSMDAAAVQSVVLACVEGMLGKGVEASSPLLQAGLDSLAAMELRDQLARCRWLFTLALA